MGALNRRRNVYTALHRQQLPGKLVMSEHKARGTDIDVNQAYDGAGATFDFYARVHGRNSIDNRGMRIDSTVHYSVGFDNAMWDGRQMVYGDGDGILFTSFTGQLEVIAHEITHGVTQHSANLGYFGETGALNEHVSDVEGILVKQFTFRQTARESDWYIGKGLFTNAVRGKAIRSMAAPGTAYDDPVLGRDPQPAHMRDYVDTDDDNGGVHINSGILNHAFYLNAIALGGYAWEVAGTIWYVTLTERLPSSAGFDDFAQLTIDVAGEMFGNGGRVQQIVIANWFKVGLLPRLPPTQSPIAPRPQPTPLTTNIRKENTIMSTEHTDLQHNHITASMNTLGVMENSAIADTPNGRVQHLVKIYGRVKPFLLLLSTLVVLPTSWRDGIKVFIGALDAVAVVAPQLGPGEIITIDDPQPVPEFKAGKDL
ncbi:MAG TPA: M4 family metallopeptidase [Thermoanaerobaculia bacterium]|nr:M4 family metallopeptidase [Thermoanaerobaculia bacterium]